MLIVARVKAQEKDPVVSIVQPASGGEIIEPTPIYSVQRPIILPANILGK